jgi:hypothetical protein
LANGDGQMSMLAVLILPTRSQARDAGESEGHSATRRVAASADASDPVRDMLPAM